jgi:hypothetical protein
MRNMIVAITVGFAGLLSGCGKPVEEQAKKVDEGRAETRVIESADKIGYGNAGVRKKVDSVLDTNDQRIETLDQGIEKESQ